MKRFLDEALVELTEDEFSKFKALDSFKEQVFQVADEVASQTNRTVIVSIESDDIGTWKHDGFHYSEQSDFRPGHAGWCDFPAGLCSCGFVSPKVMKYFGGQHNG